MPANPLQSVRAECEHFHAVERKSLFKQIAVSAIANRRGHDEGVATLRFAGGGVKGFDQAERKASPGLTMRRILSVVCLAGGLA